MVEKQKQELAPVCSLGPFLKLFLPVSPRKRSDGLQSGGGENRKLPLSFPLGWVSPDAFSESQEGELSLMEG